jgi:pimeloyl-ACP methyl ester carboxylesterase
MFRLFKRILPLVALSAIAALPTAPAAARAAADAPADCRIGTYRLADRSVVDIGASDNGALRWRRLDGTSGRLAPNPAGGPLTSTRGWTGRPDGITVAFTPCAGRGIRFDGQTGRRIDFDVTETRFRAGDSELAGRLVLPRGAGPVPVVVLVHGSEHDSARALNALQRLFPAMGIGAFVYDKRGTGGSGGRYTQNYLLLADDAVAAAREARRLAGDRASAIGYQGASQGGWVAPLAARIEPVDFVVVCFGLAVSPAEEEREAIAYGLARHGFGAEAIARAQDFADAVTTMIGSNFQEGYDALEAARRRHASEPWFRYVRGDVTHIFLGMSEAELRRRGPALFAGVPLDYDPLPVLRNLDVPQLWILGADDIDAPSAETARRLDALAAAGRPIRVAVFPGTEHGIYEYETGPDDERLSTRQPEGYPRMMRDFILTHRLDGDYGARMSGAR